MKQFLVWFLALFSTCIFSQKNTVFEKDLLKNVLPEIEQYYNVRFSYTDNLVHAKEVSIILDELVELKSLLLTLSSQTSLKFEFINNTNIVISSFNETDLIAICGQLLSNNEIVPNALIEINNVLYYSDANGSFKIKNIPYNSTIEISSFGVKNTLLEASNCTYPNCITINLIEKEELLDQIVIDKYLASGVSKNVKQTTILTKKLDVLPGLIEPDILESIHLIPGVSNLNETVNSIHVRGGNSDQNLVLWNNIKTYNNSHLFGEISAFNPYVINKVNFINKGTSAKYGERISSVIDITSNYKPAKKITGGAGFNLIHGDVFVDMPLIPNKLSVLVSGRRSYADLYETLAFKNHASKIFQNTKIFDNTIEFSNSKNIFWFYDYTVNAAYKVSNKDLFKFNHIYSKDFLNFSAFSANENNLYTDVLNTENQGYNFEWNKEWSKKMSHQIDMYYSKYSLDYSFSNESNSGSFSDTKINEIQDFGINMNFKYDATEFAQLNFGYQFSNKNFKYSFDNFVNLNNTLLDASNDKTNSNCTYIEYQVNKPKEFLYSIGLRVNKYSSSNKIYIEPRAVLQKFVIPEFSINTSIEYKSQYVNKIQESVISNLTLENHIWALSNKTDLPILNSYQYTIGANYSENKWTVDLEAYFKKTKNINTLDFNFNNNEIFNYSTGSSSIQGLDIFIKKQLKKYNTWLSYSFNSAKYRFEELNNGNPFPSNVNIDHTIKWSHFYKWKKIDLSIGWLLHNGKPYTKINSTSDDNGEIIYSYEKLNNQNLKTYHRLDFSAVYNFRPHNNQKIKYRLGVSVINLYDRKNIINKDIRFSNNNNNNNIDNLTINDIRGTKISPNIVLRVFW
jgi:hypothetical protein